MNVTFHAVGSFAAAAALGLNSNEKRLSSPALIKYSASFVIGILVHGVLDFLPHTYPLASKFDIAFSLFLLAAMFFLVQKQNRFLILISFAGCIFPDVVDLGPAIARKYLGIDIPTLPFRVFPWHLKQYSGSIYDGSRQFESNFYHISFLLICLSLLYAHRKKFWRF